MRSFLLAIMLVSVTPAGAEVTSAGEGGFSLTHQVSIDAPRTVVWRAAINNVSEWWSDDHTVTGSASQMSIDATPLGCFCEKVDPDGGVVHLTVTFVNPNVMLRMTGGLGPLGLMGVNGNMMWEFFDAGDSTSVKFSYVVGGYYANGLGTLAAPVDGVIGDALQRLKAYVETGNANSDSGG